MPIYCYTLYNPYSSTSSEPSAQGPTNPSNFPRAMELKHSPDSTDTESDSSIKEETIDNKVPDISFDPTTFFDFQSYDYHQSQISYDQFKKSNSASTSVPTPPPFYRFIPQPPTRPDYQMYQATPNSFRQYATPALIQPQYAQRPPSQHQSSSTFAPVVYTTDDINNDLNKRRRIARGPRSGTGCYICRLRHLKCDEKKPRCVRCSMTGTSCEYPEHNKQKPIYMTDGDAKRRKLAEIRSYTMKIEN